MLCSKHYGAAKKNASGARSETQGVPMPNTAKETAKRLIDDLPDEATLEDIMYELYVKQQVERGLQAIDEGRTISHEEAKRRLLHDAG